jgi:hypothetical protein
VQKLRLFGVVLLAGLLLASCGRNNPMENIVDAPTEAKADTSLEAVTQVIEHAGVDRGWRMTLQEPGLIRGHLVVGGGKHKVDVDIAYTKETFSITYVDSVNMNYSLRSDGPYIHPKYNRWVEILKQDIQKDIEKQ